MLMKQQDGQELFEEVPLVDDSPVPPIDPIESKTKEETIREFIIGPLPSKEELEVALLFSFIFQPTGSYLTSEPSHRSSAFDDSSTGLLFQKE
jgi:hypothetical protein